MMKRPLWQLRNLMTRSQRQLHLANRILDRKKGIKAPILPIKKGEGLNPLMFVDDAMILGYRMRGGGPRKQNDREAKLPYKALSDQEDYEGNNTATHKGKQKGHFIRNLAIGAGIVGAGIYGHKKLNRWAENKWLQEEEARKAEEANRIYRERRQAMAGMFERVPSDTKKVNKFFQPIKKGKFIAYHTVVRELMKPSHSMSPNIKRLVNASGGRAKFLRAFTFGTIRGGKRHTLGQRGKALLTRLNRHEVAQELKHQKTPKTLAQVGYKGIRHLGIPMLSQRAGAANKTHPMHYVYNRAGRDAQMASGLAAIGIGGTIGYQHYKNRNK